MERVALIIDPSLRKMVHFLWLPRCNLRAMETHFLNQPVYTSDVILPECKPPCRGFSIDVYICVFLYALLTGIKTYVQNQANTEIEM